MIIWQLQKAKAQLSGLIRQVLELGPQGISVRGDLEVVVLSREEFEKLSSGAGMSFYEFMQRSPLKGAKINLTRDKSHGRDIEL